MYGHYMEQGSFWNWRVGKGYETFKVLAASQAISTRVEARVGTQSMVNDGKPHVYRVSWKEGKLEFSVDGTILETFSMSKMQIQYFTVGHDFQYSETTKPGPIFSDIRVVDRGGLPTAGRQ
jgi:hypothetical protein